MIYALVRGWLAGMAAVLIEILLAAIMFVPDISSPSLMKMSAIATLPVGLIVLLEEGLKFAALRGISAETIPFFRNAIFKGLLVGFGFALFEICLKILFRGEVSDNIISLGAISGGLLHIVTGGILGIAWFFRTRNRLPFLFPILFFLAVFLHALYNIFLAPLLLEKFS